MNVLQSALKNMDCRERSSRRWVCFAAVRATLAKTFQCISGGATMRHIIVTAVIATALGFGAGRLTIQPVSAATSHENADQVAAIAMWQSTADLRGAGLTTEKLSLADNKIAGDICHDRASIAPDVAELHDPTECMYRVIGWHSWWDRQIRGAKAQHDELERDAADSLARSWGLVPNRKAAASPLVKQSR